MSEDTNRLKIEIFDLTRKAAKLRGEVKDCENAIQQKTEQLNRLEGGLVPEKK